MENTKQIYVKDFGLYPEDDKKAAFQLRKILEQCKESKGMELCFEEGVYHFYPDYAYERWLNISNHDDITRKRIVFDLDGFEGLAIRGKNTTFIFHTDVIPFHICRSKDIIIEGITMNYQRPGYSQGTVLYADKDRIELAIEKDKYPYEVVDGRIYFNGENFSNEMVNGCLEMDSERMAPVYGVHDMNFGGRFPSVSYQEVKEGVVEISARKENAFRSIPHAGNYMILRHHHRTYPAFFLEESQNVVLKDIVVHYCDAMAVIAQFTKNIKIEHFELKLPAEPNRVFSAGADGFHFVYCGGKIEILNCLAENQLDDPVNIHGIYGKIHQKLSNREIIIELSESQQKGLCLGKEGERFRFVDRETMLPIGENVVEKVELLNNDYQYFCFREDIPECRAADVIENLEYVPDVLIKGCIFQNNRARGLLLTSAGEVMVTENTFRNAGAAILIEGDSNYWFESGYVNHIVVEKNRFENCAYVSDWGSAPIQVSPSAQKFVDGVRYHKCLEIRDNDFYCFDERILFARSIESIIFENNRIHRTDAFPPIAGEPYRLDGVLSFTEKNNTIVKQ